jgi:hypothetical protein
MKDTGAAEAYLELGRELVTRLQCAECGQSEEVLNPLTEIRETAALCPQCGEMRVPETTHAVDMTSPAARWTLQRFGIPALDVLEVRGSAGPRWYEVTGDLETFAHPLEHDTLDRQIPVVADQR